MVVLSYLLGSVGELVLPRLFLADARLLEGLGGLIDDNLLLDFFDRFPRGVLRTQRRLLHLCLCRRSSTSSRFFLAFGPRGTVLQPAPVLVGEFILSALCHQHVLALDARERLRQESFLTFHEVERAYFTGSVSTCQGIGNM